MKKFIVALSVFLSPFLIAVFIEIFVLPIDFFAFRTWEAVCGSNYYRKALGPFYPNIEIDKVQVGDLARHTPYAVKKKTRWITDGYGYRKKETTGHAEIVIVGDSNTVGSGISQEEILSEVLERKTGKKVYPFAPAGFKSFFYDKRFHDNPPDIVIFEIIERGYYQLQPPSLPNPKAFVLLNELREIIREWHIQPAVVLFDRAFVKMNMFHYLKAAVNPRNTLGVMGRGEVEGKQMVFLQGKFAHRKIPMSHIDRTVGILKQYSDLFRKRGIRFIFFSIPNKETVYFRNVVGLKSRSRFLLNLQEKLAETDIEFVDMLGPFYEASQNGRKLLFFSDDSHWNAAGVELAAQLLSEKIAD